MKKLPTGAPVSVRFLKTCCDGDEQLEGPVEVGCDSPSTADDMPGQMTSTQHAPSAVTRRRSRTDGLKDALQDLSPVRELVSRLGKSRSFAAADSSVARSPTEESVPKLATSDSSAAVSDKWSRIQEFRGKITKSVEGKWSDLRSDRSARSAILPGTSPDDRCDPDEELLITEEEILQDCARIDDSDTEDPAGRRSPTLRNSLTGAWEIVAAPLPSAAAAAVEADMNDVTFRSVPTPVQPPDVQTTPSRREFRLSSIRPRIYARLQRHLERSPTVAPPIASDSVTLSALQNKYLPPSDHPEEDEEEEQAEEALSLIQQPPLSCSLATPSTGLPSPMASGEVRFGMAPMLWWSGSFCRRLWPFQLPDFPSVWERLDWRHALVVLAAAVSAPLPSFLAGLLVGLTLAVGFSWSLFRLLGLGRRRHGTAAPSRVYPLGAFFNAPPEFTAETPMYKGWLHELSSGPYEPDTSHQPTSPVFVRLEANMLRISHYKGHLPRRALWSESLPNMPFDDQRIYDIAGCSVQLLPPQLHYTKLWNRRYPICVRLERCRHVTRSSRLSASCVASPLSTSSSAGLVTSSTSRTESSAPPLERSLTASSLKDTESASVVEELVERPTAAGDPEKQIWLFARTDRDKEDWYRRFVAATGADTESGNSSRAASPTSATAPSSASSSDSVAAQQLVVAATEDESLPTQDQSQSAQNQLQSAQNQSQSAQNQSQSGVKDAAANSSSDVDLHPPPPPPQQLDFDYYMTLLMPSPRSPSNDQSTRAATGHVTWFNAIIGRLAYDALCERSSAEYVQRLVQRKLSHIKLPYFIEELRATSCQLGSWMPRIVNIGEPRVDERGLWLDLSVMYEGGASMTLATKLNLMKLSATKNHHQTDCKDSAAVDNASTSATEDSVTAATTTRGEPSSSSSDPQSHPQQPSPAPHSSSSPRRSYTAGESSSSCQPASKSSTSSSCAHYEHPDEDSLEESSSEDEDTSASSTAGTGGEGASGASTQVGKRLLRVVDRVTSSRYFIQATQNRYVKKYMEDVSNTRLELSVNLLHLKGVVTINVPRPPTDRLWFGFRTEPSVQISAHPRLGTRDVTMTHVTDWIENTLIDEMKKMLVLPNMEDMILPFLHGDPVLPSRRRN